MPTHRTTIRKTLEEGTPNQVRGAFSALLRRMNTQNPKRLEKVAEVLFTQAEEGNLNAINILFDRLDGRPHQAIEVDATVDMTHKNEMVDNLLKTLEIKLANEG
jgi:hypothetical protein